LAQTTLMLSPFSYRAPRSNVPALDLDWDLVLKGPLAKVHDVRSFIYSDRTVGGAETNQIIFEHDSSLNLGNGGQSCYLGSVKISAKRLKNFLTK